MHSSVSSQPSGRRSPSRPMPVAKPPAASKAVRRNEALPPSTLRTRTRPGGRPVRTAHHPVELLGEPARPAARRPERQRPAADRHHPGVVVARGEVPQPVGLGDRVVVEEGDHRTAGRRDPGVAARGQPAGARVRQHGDGRPGGPGARAGRLLVVGVQAAQQRRVVVHDEQRSPGRAASARAPRRPRRGCRSQRSSVYTQMTTERSSWSRASPAPALSGRTAWAGPAGGALARGSPSAPAARRAPPAGCWRRGCAGVLVARYLLYAQARLDHPDVHQGLDLEPGAVERDAGRGSARQKAL